MGRKGSFAERPVKGPGRKTKKQGPPVLTKGFKGPQVYILISHHLINFINEISSLLCRWLAHKNESILVYKND